MILYFDTFITEIPWPGRSRDSLREDIRKNCAAYALPKRIEIAKYSLASYAFYPWSDVLIKYELDDPKDIKEFDKYILKLFPKALIIHERSDSQEDYKKSFEILESMRDNWIFFAPNNDHPLVTSDINFIDYIDRLIKKAEKFKKKYSFVSILYSHFSDYINLPKKGTPMNIMHGRDITIIEEDDLAISFIAPKGNFDSLHIAPKNLFKQWFVTSDLKGRRVIRVEDVDGYADIKNHLVIVPKKELCAHFDGFEHTLGSPNEIDLDRLPPLFIPKGFFTNTVKIVYGYDKYRQGWVNINSKAGSYSFRDNKYGTDLKICLEDIPLFWKSRIKRIDINKDADLKELRAYRDKHMSLLQNPWLDLEFNNKTVRFYVRLTLYKLLVKLGIVDIVRPIQKKHRALFYILHRMSIKTL